MIIRINKKPSIVNESVKGTDLKTFKQYHPEGFFDISSGKWNPIVWRENKLFRPYVYLVILNKDNNILQFNGEIFNKIKDKYSGDATIEDILDTYNLKIKYLKYVRTVDGNSSDDEKNITVDNETTISFDGIIKDIYVALLDDSFNVESLLSDSKFKFVSPNSVKDKDIKMCIDLYIKNPHREYISENVINESSNKKYYRKYKCPYCDTRLDRNHLVKHIEKEHQELIPEGFTANRIVFNLVNNKQTGKCVQCGKETKWNENNCRYDRFCSQSCINKYVQVADNRIMKKYGKSKKELLDDPEHQKLMLSNRSISGEYTFSDGGKHSYCGSYEKKLLEFFDKVLNCTSNEITTPGPLVEYEYKGKKHTWITDVFYAPANLVFDVKDGGDNPNTREMPEYRAKQDAKELSIKKQGKYNYIRLTNNNFDQLISILAQMKEKALNDDESKTININEFMSIGSVNPPIGINQTDGGYITPCMMNNTFVDAAYSTDPLGKNTYMIKDHKVKKVTMDAVKQKYQISAKRLKYKGKEISAINDKIKYDYENQTDVDENYFYKLLTGKDNILDKNQIFFDENFETELSLERKCDLVYSILVESLLHDEDISFPLLESSQVLSNEYINELYPNVVIKESVQGVFAENTKSHLRTKYYNSINNIDEDTLCTLNNI